ncbi:MAG: hypothetical protein B7733_11825 [Myxococcales bacterium FL481]|nr:MAG: hypothetical protein B7733_11825 [Myxococcales bacterium FL481]
MSLVLQATKLPTGSGVPLSGVTPAFHIAPNHRNVLVLAPRVHGLRLDGCFHVGSAFPLPTAPASYAAARNRAFRFVFGEPVDHGVAPPDSDVLPEKHPRRTTTVPFLRAVLWWLHADAERQLCVAGHADPLGSNYDNLALSKQRAEGVVALLEGNEQAFVDVLNATSVEDDDPCFLSFAAQSMHWRCAPPSAHPSGADRKYAVGSFQALHNRRFEPPLAVDGKVGPATRAGYFRVYEDTLARWVGGEGVLRTLRESLRYVPSGKVLACGEEVPAAAGSESARRVEALTLTPDSGVDDLASAERAYRSEIMVMYDDFAAIARPELEPESPGEPSYEERERELVDADGPELEREHENTDRSTKAFYLKLLRGQIGGTGEHPPSRDEGGV